MDKYQEDLMSNIKFAECDLATMKYISNPYENNVVKIIQNEDITHTKYLVYIERGFKFVAKLEVCENDEFREIDKTSLEKYSETFKNCRETYVIEFDFDNPIITKIKIHFVNDLADPFEIPVEYVEADKEKYYQGKEKERTNELIKQMRVTHACGNDLVTIKFNHCSESVASTEISLFDDMLQLMGIFKVEEGMFYKSITNLAYGKYHFVVKQYDKDNNLIISTDYIPFRISKPDYSREHVVIR